MSLQQHIEALKKRHTDVDMKVRAEEARPFPDTVLLHQLKHQKLSLKDEMMRLLEVRQQAA